MPHLSHCFSPERPLSIPILKSISFAHEPAFDALNYSLAALASLLIAAHQWQTASAVPDRLESSQFGSKTHGESCRSHGSTIAAARSCKLPIKP